MDEPSRSQVKKAGSTLRKCLRGEIQDDETFQSALLVMEQWRRPHASPLVAANNGLRSRARSLDIDAEVTQRLKRSQTILDKLERQPTLDLSRMQDIGGCRAVLENKTDLRKLEKRIIDRLDVVPHTDYIINRRASGYRGVHVVVTYSGRNIELQLRTQVMHEWALATESYSQTQGQNFKQDGTHPIQIFLKTAADIMAIVEDGHEPSAEILEAHDQSRLTALPYLSQEGGHEDD